MGFLSPSKCEFLVGAANRFILIGVTSEVDLADIFPDQEAIERISEVLDLVGFYVFAVTSGTGLAHATTRMFAPRFGIPEESATGMAAGPLACLLHDVLGDRRSRFVIEQGRFMAQPSVSRILVDLDLRSGRIAGLMAGGPGHLSQTIDVSRQRPIDSHRPATRHQ